MNYEYLIQRNLDEKFWLFEMPSSELEYSQSDDSAEIFDKSTVFYANLHLHMECEPLKLLADFRKFINDGSQWLIRVDLNTFQHHHTLQSIQVYIPAQFAEHKI